VLSDDVRAHCAGIAARARHVHIDPAAEVPAGGVAGLDPGLHFLEGPAQDVARYVLILDAVNFGSGWFAELGVDTDGLTARLSAHARADGPWSAAALRGLTATDVGDVLALDPAHALTGLYAQALNQLGGWLGDGPLALGDSAGALAERLTAMPFFADAGFYKRAQIAAHDLHLAGVADYVDVARLTVFADNLLPHVLRHFGVLVYDDALAARVDAGEELPQGSAQETEIRACAVHACEGLAARFGVPPATLDNWLWNRGSEIPGRPHITRTVYY
jgi:Potential Queuosine, Q, salvage protein family